MSGKTAAVNGEALAAQPQGSGSGQDGNGPGHGSLESTLESVRRNASELLAGVASPPSHLRVSAGEVTIELEWRPPEQVLVAAAPAPANGAQGAPVALAQHAAPAPAADAPPADPGHHYIPAPIVGVFYQSPEPGAPPFVEEGTRVNRGQQVGIVEAMKMMIPVEADRDGVVASVLVPDGTAVEYGERLLALDVTSAWEDH